MTCSGFSALQRAEIAETVVPRTVTEKAAPVSVLFNEPKLLKVPPGRRAGEDPPVSVLFNEPKLLKHY